MISKTVTAERLGQAALDAAVAALPDDPTVQRLVQTYVQRDPRRPGLDRARVVAGGHGTPIWAIIGDLRGGEGLESTAATYELPKEAVLAAIGFYREHQAVIDHRLAINDGANPSIG